jgi:membrane protease subunit (stomatin/prohibitin family)
MVWKKLLGEFVDVIAWTDDSADTMVYRFERYGNEIKYGAQLTVRESQMAVFVSEGRIADTFAPGMYTLETRNLPIFSTLEAWPHGFESPFKAEVYFVSTRRFTDLKWGTKHPVTLRDKEFGPVRLRAFGTYSVRVADPPAFLKEVVGTDGHFTVGEIADQLRDLIVSRFASILGESAIPVLDLAANYDDLAAFLSNAMQPDFRQYGIELLQVLVENVSMPPEVEAALDKRTSMGVIGDLKRYAQFQAAEAMGAAAANPGGIAGAGVGMGVGVAIGKQMSDVFAGGAGEAATSPPPLPSPPGYFIAVDGRQQGPFDQSGLEQARADGRLTANTLVWTRGMAAWVRAAEVSELAALLAATPPPLPPHG